MKKTLKVGGKIYGRIKVDPFVKLDVWNLSVDLADQVLNLYLKGLCSK